MTVIKRENKEFGIFNQMGKQVEGAFTPNSKGLSPIELLEASLGLCIVISLQRMFERDDITVLDHEFSVEVSAKKALEGPSRVERCMVTVKFPEHFTAEYKKKLIISAERACTIGNTLKQGLTIDIEETI